jgi:DNA-binding NtrC family response regulator
MKKTILISNRDDQEVDSLSAFFHKIGYRVETARLLVDMLNKVRSTNIQVLLLDDEIEGVKAWDLIPLVKKIKPWLQVIMISSEGSIDWVRRLRRAGIFYQAMKPVDLEEVESAVTCAFEKIERERLREEPFSFFVPGRVLTLCSN